MATGTFVHQAVAYDDRSTLMTVIAPIVQGALDRGESPIVVLDADNGDALRESLVDGSRLEVTDPNDVYTRPWRTFASYVETVLARADAGEPVLVVGETPYATCSADDAAEWLRVECALNVGLRGVDALMLCPYRRTTGDLVMHEMARVHPELRHGDGTSVSETYVEPSAYLREARDVQLPALGAPNWEMRFDGSALGDVRRAVTLDAELAGLDRARVPEFVLAVSEIAANSVKHGGGAGILRLWTLADAVVCEIEDTGTLGASPLGMLPPDRDKPTGRGLWIARQFSDSLAIVTRPGGTVARVRVATRQS